MYPTPTGQVTIQSDQPRNGWVKSPICGVIALIGALAALVGSVGPWATVTSGFVDLTVNGASRDGQITAPLSLIACALIGFRLWGSGKGWSVLLAFIVLCIVNAITFIDWQNVNDLFQDSEMQSLGVYGEVGWGLAIATFGSGWSTWALVGHWWRGEVVR